MGKSQSKPKTPAKKRPQKGQRKSPRRTSDQPDSPYVNPNEETAEASFDKPARVRMLTTATKERAGVGPPRRPPTRKGRRETLDRTNEETNGNAPNKEGEETPPKTPTEAAADSPLIRVSSPTASEQKKTPKTKSDEEKSKSPLSLPRPESAGLLSAFVPSAASNAPRSPSLPRLTLKVDASLALGHSPGSVRRELFAKKGQSKSVPYDGEVAAKSASVTRTKSLYSSPLAENGDTGASPALKRPKSATPPPKSVNVRKVSPVSNKSPGASPRQLPRLAFDTSSVQKMLADKEKEKKKRKKKDEGSETEKKEKKRRRSSFESALPGQFWTGPSHRKFSNPEQFSENDRNQTGFYTPQVRKTGFDLTPKLGRPQMK